MKEYQLHMIIAHIWLAAMMLKMDASAVAFGIGAGAYFLFAVIHVFGSRIKGQS